MSGNVMCEKCLCALVTPDGKTTFVCHNCGHEPEDYKRSREGFEHLFANMQRRIMRMGYEVSK